LNAKLLLACRAVAFVAALATLGLIGWAASWSWSGLAFLVGVTVWCISPYALLALAARKPRESRSSAVTLLATTLVVAVSAGIVYGDTFFVHVDAQGALILLFFPLWQWVGALAGVVVANQLEFRARKP
jgi:hypothetical protein